RFLRVPLPCALAGIFLSLALASALWSVRPHLTAARAVSLFVVFATAVALSIGAAGRPVAAGRILVGALAGMLLVAVAGLALFVVAPHAASHPGTGRLNGIGGDANTVSSL